MLVRLDEHFTEEEAKASYVEFQLAETRVAGFGGCNRFTGRVELASDTLTFGALASTKMACPGLSEEAAFLRALSGQRLSFRLEKQQLQMSNGSTELLFRAAE